MVLAILLLPLPYLGYKLMDRLDAFLNGVHRE